MTAKEALAAYLKADATITGIIGDRIAPVVEAQGIPVPRIVYSEDEAESVSSLNGRSGLRKSSFELVIHTLNPTDTANLSERIRAIMMGYRGYFVNPDFFVQASFVKDERDEGEERIPGSEDTVLRYVMEVYFWHAEN